MADQYTTVANESWFSRIGGSLKGSLLGILLFIASIILLWWNEGRAVRTAKGLEEGLNIVVGLEEPILDEVNNKALIHFNGQISTSDSLHDPAFHISVKGIKLKRIVEMYQWIETESSTTNTKTGGGKETKKEYTYSKEWSSDLINSNQFEVKAGHVNPTKMLYESYTETAKNVTIGDFMLSLTLQNKLKDFESLLLNHSNLPQQDGNLIKEGENNQPETKIYLGKGSYNQPKIGDIKVSFRFIPEAEYSIVAQQVDGELKTYHTATGTEILMITKGNLTAKEMFDNAFEANTTLTWGMRFAGALMMFFALVMMVHVLETIASFIPFLGNIIGLGIKLFAGATTVFISMLIIGMAWLYYRPILGGILVIIGLGTLLFLYKKSLDHKRA
jgi:hypothetical protein